MDQAQFLTKPEQGYWLNFSPGPEEIQHEFCGSPDIPGSQCPRCEKPLMRLLSLDARDPRLEVDSEKTPFVHLFYCWTCSVPYDAFTYRLTSEGGIEILEIPERQPEMEFGLSGPYDGFIGVYPLLKASLQEISQKAQERLRARYTSSVQLEEEEQDFDLFEPRHQVGGYPFIYNAFDLKCPLCSNALPLFATICDDATGNNPWQKEETNSFVGNGGIQMFFHFCRDCSVMATGSCCD